MTYPETILTLPGSLSCTFRTPTGADADKMLEFLTATAGESHFLMRYPEEVTLTPEQERAFLEEHARPDYPGALIIAEIAGIIVGCIGVDLVSPHLKARHRASFGITIRHSHWGLGLGRLLLEHGLEVAKQMGCTQMELGVYADNHRAIALYEVMGFEVWGRTKNAFRLKDGTLIDEILMGKLF